MTRQHDSVVDAAYRAWAAAGRPLPLSVARSSYDPAIVSWEVLRPHSAIAEFTSWAEAQTWAVAQAATGQPSLPDPPALVEPPEVLHTHVPGELCACGHLAHRFYYGSPPPEDIAHRLLAAIRRAS